MFFVELYSEKLIEQRREPERLEAEQLGCDSRIEDVSCVPAVILVQKTKIVVGIVEDDLHILALEQATQLFRRAEYILKMDTGPGGNVLEKDCRRLDGHNRDEQDQRNKTNRDHGRFRPGTTALSASWHFKVNWSGMQRTDLWTALPRVR